MKQLKIVNTALLLISILMTSCGQEGMKFYNEGVVLMEQREFPKAIEVFSSGIEVNDMARSINYYGRAYSYFEIKQFEKAKSDIDNGLKTETVNKENINSDMYWLKGMIASAEGDKQLEIESYEKAIEYSSENLWLKTTLGLALIENNEPQKALEVLNNVIEQNNQDAYAYNNRALAYFKVGELEMAKADLDESKKLDNQNPFLYKNYFLYYKEKKDPENACRAIQEALKRDMSEYGEENDTKELKALKNKFCANSKNRTPEEYLEKGKYIWQNYVPKSGQAEFVQGELLRAIEKLRDEAQRNGNGNFNEECQVILIDYLRNKLTDTKVFDGATITKINKDLDRLTIRNQPYLEDDIFDYIADRIIDWNIFYGDGIKHEENPKLRC